jgi:hypothetical protein
LKPLTEHRVKGPKRAFRRKISCILPDKQARKGPSS